MRFCIDGHELTSAKLRNAFSGINARVNAGFVNNPKPAFFTTARSRVCFIQAFGYGYRAVAKAWVAYVAMIGWVIAR